MTPGSGTQWMVPADNELISAVGRAIYNFAQLELCLSRLRRELCRLVDDHVPGASPEAVLVELESGIGQPSSQSEVARRVRHVLHRYHDLKPKRDRLLCPLHGTDGSPRGCNGEITAAEMWRTAEILGLAHEFEVAAIEANQVLRRYF